MRGWGTIETRQYRAVRQPGMERLARHVSLPELVWPAVLDGDAETAPVLVELLDHSDPSVHDWAVEGLVRITSGDTGPWVQRVHRSIDPVRRMPGTPVDDSPGTD